MNRKRVLVVDWPGAEWSAVHPALDRGELPHLRALVEKGSSGPLATFEPLRLPIVATTLATGFCPADHGVLGRMECRPDGGGVQPIGRRSWRKPALWEILAANGLKTAIINWPATIPASLWPGIVVDDRFAVAEGRSFEEWPLPPASVAPEALRDVMADLRVHPVEIGAAEISALVPSRDAIDTRRDRRPARLAVSLARAASVHAATTHLVEKAEWDFMLTRYPLLSDVWRDLAARPSEEESDLYDQAGLRACQLLDVMLGRLLELAGPDLTVFVLSAAGRAEPSVRDGAEEVVPDKGLLVACGPDIQTDALFHRASVLDIAPTVLACFGLSAPGDGVVLSPPLARDMPRNPATLPQMPVTAPGPDPAAHLLAIGYADRLGEAQIKAMADAELAALCNLADSHSARQQWRDAVAILETVLQKAPDDYLAHIKLGRCLLLLGDADRALAHAQVALAAEPALPWADLLVGSIHAAAGDEAAAAPHLARARSLGGGIPSADFRLGWVAVMLGRWSEAETSFRAVLKAKEGIAEAHAGLGICLQGQGRIREAEIALRRAIALVYGNPLAHFHLAQVLSARGAHAEAMAALQVALALEPGLAGAEEFLVQIESKLARSAAAGG